MIVMFTVSIISYFESPVIYTEAWGLDKIIRIWLILFIYDLVYDVHKNRRKKCNSEDTQYVPSKGYSYTAYRNVLN